MSSFKSRPNRPSYVCDVVVVGVFLLSGGKLAKAAIQPTRAVNSDCTGISSQFLKVVTAKSPEAVYQSFSVSEKVSCGLWNTGTCTRVTTRYRIVYELRTKLTTSVSNTCCPGFLGDECTATCRPGSYGKQCAAQCGRCKNNDPCDHVTGFCPSGCEAGYGGDRCDTDLTTTTTTTTTTVVPVLTTSRRPATWLWTTTVRPVFSTDSPAIVTRIPATGTTTLRITPQTKTPLPVTKTTTTTTTTTTVTKTVKTTTTPVPEDKTSTGVYTQCTASALSKQVRLQALPTDIVLLCRVQFPMDSRYRNRSVSWLFKDAVLDRQSGRYSIVDSADLVGNVISELTIVNASWCHTGNYTCRGQSGSCDSSATMRLHCPALPPEATKKYPVPGCCPRIVAAPFREVGDYTALNIAVPVTLAIILIIVIVVLPVVIYKTSSRIQILVRHFCGRYEDNDSKLYDVYISFNHEDETLLRFVCGHVRPFLLHSGFTAFIFPLDSVPGSHKSDSITDAMEQSRRVLVIFSKSYRSCEWCRFEFITARRLFIKQRLKIIPVLCGENMKDILKDADFSSVLKSIPFIKIGEGVGESLSPKLAKMLRLRLPRHSETSKISHEMQTTSLEPV